MGLRLFSKQCLQRHIRHDRFSMGYIISNKALLYFFNPKSIDGFCQSKPDDVHGYNFTDTVVQSTRIRKYKKSALETAVKNSDKQE